MEVVVPVQDLHFHGKTTTYMSAPSSPCHYSTSPTSSTAGASASTTSLLITDDKGDDFAFAFAFSSHLDKNAPPPELTTADELFYKGKIRPLKFPLRLSSPDINAKQSDPFSASKSEPNREGRGRNRASFIASRSRKGSRSLSPLRGENNPNLNLNPDPFTSPLNSSITSPLKGEDANSNSKKWRFKDLFLFRSASEGRATGDRNKDALRKYTAACSLPKCNKGCEGDESRSSSFRWLSPHAMHYEANRAAAEEMKRKTALPYKESIFSWFRKPGLRGFSSRAVGGDHSVKSAKSFAVSKSMPRLR